MVEWKKIEDLGPYFGGLTGKTKDDFVEGNAKFITYMNVFANPSLDISSTGVVRINEGEKQNKIQKGDILFTGSSETPDEAGMSCVVTDELNEDYYMNSFCFGIRLNNPEQYCLGYLKHILRSSDIRKSISKSASGVTRFNISKARFGKILIPFPSLKDQQSIVDKLDTFTSSIDNLKQQIAQRRKQYEYYRDQLLDLEGKEGVEKRVLKEVCEVINGRAYSQPELLDKGKYRVLRVGNFFSNDSWYYSDLELEDKYYCNKGDLLYAWSASFGPHIWEEEKVIYHYHIWKMNCKEALDTKYMYYWLQSEDMKKQAFSNLHGATMAHLTKVLMESLKVPVPSLSEQQRIVDILDKFEASIQNLEAQLSQREKQYEYYRNKLLTFD